MQKLPAALYYKALEALSKIPYNILMARSVATHHADGAVYADTLETPKTFYIVHQYGMSYLFGNSSNDAFNQALFSYFQGHTYPRQKDEWLQVFPQHWHTVMAPLAESGQAIPQTRINFKFDPVKFYERYSQTDTSQYNIIPTPVDQQFNIEGKVVPKNFWKAHSPFLHMATAFTVMIDGVPASTAFTSARHDHQLEIGIETKPEYHGKGLAYLACAKLIEHCLEHNLEPIWACRANNPASINLCNKLGFTETLRMPYYQIPLGCDKSCTHNS